MGKVVYDADPFVDTLRLVGKSTTSPREQKQGKICYVDVFKVSDLAVVMDKKGWKVAPVLMRKWLDSKAHQMGPEEKGNTEAANFRKYPPHLVDTRTVTMKWVLSYARAKQAYDAIFSSGGWLRRTPPIYESELAKNRLVKLLAKAGKFTYQAERFGDFTAPVLDINADWQFQIQPINDGFEMLRALTSEIARGDPKIDDLWGALGRFAFNIAGEGWVTPKTRIVTTGGQSRGVVDYYDIAVTRIGVYAFDTYEFNDEKDEPTQYLGHWSRLTDPYLHIYPDAYFSGNLKPRGACPNEFLGVGNSTFLKHREISGKGGDLVIFSDVLIAPLKQPFKFRVTPAKIDAILKAPKP